MLKFNVNIADGLVNGTIGTILDFVFDGSRLKAVIIKFDNPEVGNSERPNCLIFGSAEPNQNRNKNDRTISPNHNEPKTSKIRTKIGSFFQF